MLRSKRVEPGQPQAAPTAAAGTRTRRSRLLQSLLAGRRRTDAVAVYELNEGVFAQRVRCGAKGVSFRVSEADFDAKGDASLLGSSVRSSCSIGTLRTALIAVLMLAVASLAGCDQDTKPLPGGYSITHRDVDGWVIHSPPPLAQVVAGGPLRASSRQESWHWPFVEGVAVSGTWVAARVPDVDQPAEPWVYFLVDTATRKVRRLDSTDEFARAWKEAGGRGPGDFVAPEDLVWP